MKQYIIQFFLCVCPFVLNGQTIMSLRDCMQYAINHSSQIEIQQANIDDARLSRRDAILKTFTPSISGGSYAYLNFGRSVDPETNTYMSVTSFNNGYSLSGNIVLFNGFSAVNNIRIAKTAINMGLTRAEQLQDEICLAIIEAYCNVLYYKKMQDALHSQVVTAQANLNLVKKQETLGQKSYADVIQLEANLADREYQLTLVVNQYHDAMLTLKDLMLFPLDQEFDIVAEVPLLSDFSAEPTYQFYPSLQLAEWQLKNAKVDLMTARWRFAPSLSLSGGWSTSYYTYPGMINYVAKPYFEQLINNGGEYIQFSLSVPIYDGLSRYSNISRKKNAFRRAKAEYQQTRHDVEIEIIRATQDCEGAKSALLQADKYMLVQAKAYELSVKKFEQGILSPTELRTASDNYLQSQAEQLNSHLKYFIKHSVVNYYKGNHYINQF